MLAAVDPQRFDVVAVGIDRDGGWHLAEPAADRLGASGPPVTPVDVLSPDSVAFPLLHGPFGEDGTVQGLLEVLDVPYVGTGVLGSALCMDKAMAKSVLASHGIAQVRYLALRADQVGELRADQVGDELGWPVFVKPANLGSSVGISKVAGPDELAAAIELALNYDDVIVVEEASVGRELECGVLGNLGGTQASVVGEVVPTHDFYDYEDKYLDGAVELRVPAPIPHRVAEEVRALAVRTAEALRAEGMARVDVFWDPAGRGLLVNEVNTIPGFTPYSMYPALWAASGIDYPTLVDRLVALAVERHARRAGRVGRSR